MKERKISTKMILSIAGLLVVVAMTLTACGGSKSSSSEESSGGSSEKFDVSLVDSGASMSIETDPNPITVKKGTEVTLNVTNDGTVVHNLTENGNVKTADLPVSGKGTLDLGKLDKSVTVYCAIPGHKEAGMHTEIVVE